MQFTTNIGRKDVIATCSWCFRVFIYFIDKPFTQASVYSQYDTVLSLQYKNGYDVMPRMQKTNLQKVYQRFSILSKLVLGMCGKRQDRPWWYKERRRDLL